MTTMTAVPWTGTDLTSALLADPVRSRQIGERIPGGRWGTADDLSKDSSLVT